MVKRLFFILQSLSLIPPIGTFIFWVSRDYSPPIPSVVFVFVLSVTPFVLIILTKYIVYGKFYIFKIGKGEEIEEGEEK